MSDIRGTIGTIAKNVTKTSGDFLKTTKLGMNLSSEETNLKNIHLEIGRKVHEIYQYGGSLGKYFDDKYLEIEACERKIADIREQISVIKGTKACIKCGKTVERSSEFCPKCGIRLEAGTAAEPATAGAEAVQSADAMHGEPYAPGAMPSVMPGQQAPYRHAAPAEYAPPPMPPPVPAPPPVPPSVSVPPAVQPLRCRICDAQNEPGTKFCLSCGRIID